MLTFIWCRISVFQFAIQKYSVQNYNLAVVLYGCETWSLAMKEKCRLKVFENRVLRRIFGPKMDEVTGEWKNYMRSLKFCTPHPVLFR